MIAHRRSTGKGCILAALASDIARSDPEIKAACEAGLREIQNEVERHFPAQTEELAREIWGMMALELGGLLLSRMVASEETAGEILCSCRGAVQTLIQSMPVSSTTPDGAAE